MNDQTSPLTDQQLDQIEARATARRAALSGWINCYSPLSEQEAVENVEAVLEEAVPLLLDEVRRLRAELAETKALNDPRLRGLLVKAAPDKDLYVQWSTVCDMPGGVFSRETALEYGFPRSKVDHADKHGSSSRLGDGAWDDKGWVAEQRGWLRRDRIGDYAVSSTCTAIGMPPTRCWSRSTTSPPECLACARTTPAVRPSPYRPNTSQTRRKTP